MTSTSDSREPDKREQDDVSKVTGEPGTSHHAFTPVCKVGRPPHSTGDTAAGSSEGVHLGYNVTGN